MNFKSTACLEGVALEMSQAITATLNQGWRQPQRTAKHVFEQDYFNVKRTILIGKWGLNYNTGTEMSQWVVKSP